MRFAGLFLLLFAAAASSQAQSTNFSAGPQYLITTSSTMFLQPIATPSLSLIAPLQPISSLPQIGPVVSDQPYVSNPDTRSRANLYSIYYGYPIIPEIQLSDEPVRDLPASINNTGYLNVPSAQALTPLGFGTTLGQAASHWKSRKTQPKRVFTNEDLERLRSK